MADRLAINREVPGRCSATFPVSNCERLVLFDMDAGQLWQLGELVNGLLSEGYRALTLNVTDPHYPPEACGEHHFTSQGVHHHERADGPHQRLYRTDSSEGMEAVYTMLEGGARKAVYTLLAQVGSLTRSHANAAAIAINIYRRPETLAARIDGGIVPRCHLVLGIDFAEALDCSSAEANCVFVRRGRGLEAAAWHPGRSPLTFQVWPSGRSKTRRSTAGDLAGYVARFPDRPALVRAIEEDSKLGPAVWADWPALRFSGAVTATARPDALVVAGPRSLGQQLDWGSGSMDVSTDSAHHRGYRPALDRITDLSMVIDSLMTNAAWTITLNPCHEASSQP